VYDPASAARQLAKGVWLLDTGFQGRGGVVAAYLLVGSEGLTLVETGASSTLDNLRAAVALTGHDLSELKHILVTHIHLDHAGAAGALVREYPHVDVRAHGFGVPHLVDPSKLVASATRIYGDRMDELWGEVVPVPESQVQEVMDGELLKVSGRRLMTVFSPGHAWHHVAYFDLDTRIAFTGDAGGVRMPGTEYVVAPTPPPDLDEAVWKKSIHGLRSMRAQTLCPTHFGPFTDVAAHLERVEQSLDELLAIGREAADAGLDREALTERLRATMAEHLGDVPPGILANLEWATPSYVSAMGLERLERKRREVASG
jgi:glyoxylase-like metal-dependent hydrolase (beta-lactamase superfamily II)